MAVHLWNARTSASRNRWLGRALDAGPEPGAVPEPEFDGAVDSSVPWQESSVMTTAMGHARTAPVYAMFGWLVARTRGWWWRQYTFRRARVSPRLGAWGGPLQRRRRLPGL